jgi:hypothetical protein
MVRAEIGEARDPNLPIHRSTPGAARSTDPVMGFAIATARCR